MRKVWVYVSLGLAILAVKVPILAGCAEFPEYVVTNENHVESYAYPSTGVYYEYRFSSYTEEVQSVESTLIELAEESIVVLDAWYQKGSAMCVPPDGSKGMNVIVIPRFVVRLKKKNSAMQSRNFKYKEKPEGIFCGYYVKRFHLDLDKPGRR